MAKHNEVAEVKEKVRDITRQLIRELRDRDQLTQTELAQRIGINRSLISQYESGDREPSLLSLVKLADYAHVSVDSLLGRNSGSKYELTKPEEQIIQMFRKVPPGHEISIMKDEKIHSGEESLKGNQIKVRQDVKIDLDEPYDK